MSQPDDASADWRTSMTPPPPASGPAPDPYGAGSYGATTAPPPTAFSGYTPDVGSAPGVPQLPAGVELASAGVRIGAYLVAAVLAVVTLGIGYIIWSLIVWKDGTTPSYQVLGLRCYQEAEGRRASWGAMAMREIVGWGIILGIVPFASLVSLVLFLARSDRKGIPELISGTVVVRER